MNSDLLYVFSVRALLNITEQAIYAAKKKKKRQIKHQWTRDQCNVLS